MNACKQANRQTCTYTLATNQMTSIHTCIHALRIVAFSMPLTLLPQAQPCIHRHMHANVRAFMHTYTCACCMSASVHSLKMSKAYIDVINAFMILISFRPACFITSLQPEYSMSIGPRASGKEVSRGSRAKMTTPAMEPTSGMVLSHQIRVPRKECGGAACRGDMWR